MSSEHKCKDCKAEIAAWVAWLNSEPEVTGQQEPKAPKRVRKADKPGPRCFSHWGERKKEVKAANHEKRVQGVYGLQAGEYAQLYKFQGGLCALCRRATGASKKLAVDHDHATGEVRGLCCSTCNRILGHARDKTEYFRRAVRYLNIPPYARMKEGWEWDE